MQKLTRVAVGPVKLGEMPAGAYRPLTREEVRALRDSVSAPDATVRRGTPKRRKPARSKPAKAAATSPKRRIIQ